MSDCMFCKIANKEIQSTEVADTDHVYAFRDINPAAPTHVLLIPKEHIESAREMGADHGALLGEIFEVAGKVAAAEGVAEGYRIVTNVGTGAGQSVFHVHFHLLGGRDMSWPPG